MELRSHFLNALVNDEVEAYLEESDVILVPFGPTELHGGLPLDCETVVSEALALIMAKQTNSLVLPNLPYVYSGATASGKGTIQLSVQDSSRLLYGIAKSLLRSGFKRQVYFSLHGPAQVSMNPVVRDFFDETGHSIVYVDAAIAMMKSGVAGDNPQTMLGAFDRMIVGAYKLRNRLDDILLTEDYAVPMANSTSDFSHILQSGTTGYYFLDHSDHMPTTPIPDEETRDRLADEGIELLEKLAAHIDLPKILEQMEKQADYNKEAFNKYPHVPAAYKNESSK